MKVVCSFTCRKLNKLGLTISPKMFNPEIRESSLWINLYDEYWLLFPLSLWILNKLFIEFGFYSRATTNGTLHISRFPILTSFDTVFLTRADDSCQIMPVCYFSPDNDCVLFPKQLLYFSLDSQCFYISPKIFHIPSLTKFLFLLLLSQSLYFI